METSKVLLAALGIKYRGDWDKVYGAIVDKENPEEKYILAAKDAIKTKSDKKYESGYVSILDDKYSTSLKQVNQPPFGFYYSGNIDLLKEGTLIDSVAISGSTDPIEIEVRQTATLIAEISDINPETVIITSLDKGIERAAAVSALDSGLKVIAVLPHGLDIEDTNLETRELLKEIIRKKGLIISEYDDTIKYKDISANKAMFRNRIVAGLGYRLVIPVLKKNSSTLITAAMALSLGKDIYVMPVSPEDARQREVFNNQLIKEGANLIDTAKDLNL